MFIVSLHRQSRKTKNSRLIVAQQWRNSRVRQRDCKDDTALLNRRRNLCLRSPQKMPFSGDPKN